MIAGSVSAELEAAIPIAVIDSNGDPVPLEGVIDTGFSGYLTLPNEILERIGGVWLGREDGILADGNVVEFDVFRVMIQWRDQLRVLEVQASDSAPLLGMSLLHQNILTIQVISNGVVTISPFP